MRKLLIAVAILCGCIVAHANERAQGFCTVGGKAVVTQGLNSTNVVQASYPQCIVTVYLHGTQTLATLFSDNNSTPTPLTNPFTANSDGSWGFYADLGRYDVVLSGGQFGGFAVPFTLSDVLLQDCTNNQCGGGTALPSVHQVISGDGAGNGVGMPEKPTTLVTGSPNTATVQCDEDWSQGRFDARCTKYAGGVYGSTPGAAWQAFSDQLICYQGMTGRHARTTFPPGTFSVGTDAQPTLKLPIGAIYMGGGGWGFGTNATQFQATYNNRTAVEFDGGLTSTTNCSDGVPHTSSITGGSYDGFSEHGCAQGGCHNVPGDGGTYPFGGPLQMGIVVKDAQGSSGQRAALFANNNAADGVVCSGGLDSHCFHLGGAANNGYFYFGMDTAGQNYQFSSGECHGDVSLLGLDNMNEGPFEVYGTFMTLGAEYHHIAGVCWGGGNTNLGPVFSQIEEIGVIHMLGGNTNAVMMNGRIDAARGVGIYNQAGNTSFVGNRVIASCSANPATSYIVYSVTTATPGSGQTPGTYLLNASIGSAQISVTVAGGGTVATNPTITINGRGYTSTPPTFTLAAGGTPATFTVTMQNYQFDPGTNAPLHCTPVEDTAGNDTWVGNQLVGSNFFPTQYPTSDAFAEQHNTWMGNIGNFSTQQLRFQNDTGNATGNNQTVVQSDIGAKYGGTAMTGTVIDVDTTGYHVAMANGSATTLTDLLHPRIMADLWIMGDGFTTMPYLPSIVGSGTTSFGAVNCSGFPLLMKANTWYHFLVTTAPNILSGFHPVLAEQCESIDMTHWWVNYDANLSSLPPLAQRGSIDSIGDIRSHAMPALAAPSIQAGGTPGANGVGGTYTYSYRVWGTYGTQTYGAVTVSQCLPLPGFVNNPCFQTLHWAIPQGTNHVQLFRETSTDSVATAGMIFEQTWTTPQIATAQTFPDTRTAPINANIIGSANFNANVTGGISGKCGTIPPATAYPGIAGQACDDPVGGFRYYADSDDHWERTPATYSTF